jgi:hypothetical protein
MFAQVVFPAFSFLDQALSAFLPLVLRIFIWGLAGGMAVILLYALLSAQKTIAELKRRSRELRKEMMNAELSGTQFANLVKENLQTSLGLLRRVLVPALVSAAPVIVLASWMLAQHGYQLPEKDHLELQAGSEETQLRVQPSELVKAAGGGRVVLKPEARSRRLTLVVNGRPIYSGTPFEPIVPEIRTKMWWDAILGSQTGYLRPQSPIDRVRVTVEARRLFPKVPAWMARWEVVFFLGVCIGALVIKRRFQIA